MFFLLLMNGFSYVKVFILIPWLGLGAFKIREPNCLMVI